IAETIRRIKAEQAASEKEKQKPRAPPEPVEEAEQSEGEAEVQESEEDVEEDAEADVDAEVVDTAADDGEEVSAADARRFIKAIRKSKKRQVSSQHADPKQLTEHFKTWGRHCHRLCGLYTDIHKTIVCGMTVLRADPCVDEDFEACYKAIPNMSASSAKLYTDKFFFLCDNIPKFMALCEQIIASPEDVFIFAKYMQVHAAAGRTTDISTLKTSFHSYFPYVVISKERVIPPPGPGRLIVPIDERSAFDRDPAEYCKKKIAQNKHLAAGAVRHKKRHQGDRPEHRDDNKSYPSYLFPTDLKYDKTQPQRQIFKSDFMVAIFRHLFQGPSAVGRGNGSRGLGRKTIVDIYGITQVTPEYLAYVATLVRYLVNTEDRWSGDDRQRTGHGLHVSLHRLLTVEYQAWKEDIESNEMEQSTDPLDWNVFAFFNDKVFGSEAGAPDQQDADDEDVFSSDEDDVRVQMLKARMAELEARRERRANGLRGASPPRSPPSELGSVDFQTVEVVDLTLAVVEVPSDHEELADDAAGWSLPY
ncbi:hypothetical protein BD309DRAFT_1024535, partial [Dichomitus squalens]